MKKQILDHGYPPGPTEAERGGAWLAGKLRGEPQPPSGEAVCPECGGSGRDGGSSAPCPTCLKRSGRAEGEGSAREIGTIDDMRRVCAESIGVPFDDTTPGLDACVYVVCAHLRETKRKLAAEQQARAAAEGQLRATQEFRLEEAVRLLKRAQAAESARDAAVAERDAAITTLKELLEAECEYMTGHVSQERWGAARKAADELLEKL